MLVDDLVAGWWSSELTRLRLKVYREKAQTKRKAVVIMLHGMTSHLNEGAYVAKELSKKGYEVVGFDQRGFGKSEGTRGYIRDFEMFMKDA